MMIWALLVALAMTPVAPRGALAQVTKAAIGTAVGVGGGAVITMSIVVARARFQGVYVESADDLIHWQSAPMILTPAVGLFFGLNGKYPLEQSVIGSVGGMLLGSAIGTGVGWVVSATPESPWAGGVIGAGAGMVVGGLFLGTRAVLKVRNQDDEEGGGEVPLVMMRIPL